MGFSPAIHGHTGFQPIGPGHKDFGPGVLGQEDSEPIALRHEDLGPATAGLDLGLVLVKVDLVDMYIRVAFTRVGLASARADLVAAKDVPVSARVGLART